jgi:hypothetical protein
MAAAAAEKAVRCLGRGIDMACDMRLKYCKDAGGCLVERNGGETAPLAVPGVGTVSDAPVDVKCGKGDRVRFKSGALEFSKVSTAYLPPCLFDMFMIIRLFAPSEPNFLRIFLGVLSLWKLGKTGTNRQNKSLQDHYLNIIKQREDV